MFAAAEGDGRLRHVGRCEEVPRLLAALRAVAGRRRGGSLGKLEADAAALAGALERQPIACNLRLPLPLPGSRGNSVGSDGSVQVQPSKCIEKSIVRRSLVRPSIEIWIKDGLL
jgi:hypothetical protein